MDSAETQAQTVILWQRNQTGNKQQTFKHAGQFSNKISQYWKLLKANVCCAGILAHNGQLASPFNKTYLTYACALLWSTGPQQPLSFAFNSAPSPGLHTMSLQLPSFLPQLSVSKSSLVIWLSSFLVTSNPGRWCFLVFSTGCVLSSFGYLSSSVLGVFPQWHVVLSLHSLLSVIGFCLYALFLTRHRLSVKSKSSKGCMRDYCIPDLSCFVPSCMIQSSIKRMIMDERRQPCWTPAFTLTPNFLVAVVNTFNTKTHSSKEMAEFCFENADLKSIRYCKQGMKSKLSLSSECRKRSSVSRAHLSLHTCRARVEWCGIGH